MTTMEEAKEVLLAPRDECSHKYAGATDFKCPGCGGFLRRCCQSIIGWPHAPGCPWRKPE